MASQGFGSARDEFAALLEQSFGADGGFEGRVVKGRVTAIENDMVVIDVGLKSEGRVSLREFASPGQPADIKAGDEVEVYVDRVENANGEAMLSRDRARREASWNKLEEQFQAGERVEGVIFGRVKGGFTVDLSGAVAFLPGSQVDVRPVRDVTPLMDIMQPFQILKMDRRRGNIVVSRRAILEETRAEQRTSLIANLIEGAILDGVVKNITDYGAFVDLGGVDGLLHVTDMSYRRVAHPSEVINIGDTVRVQIVRINRDTQRISLGMKQLERGGPVAGAPAAAAAGAAEGSRLNKNAIVTVTVLEVRDAGLEVQVGDAGVTGFIKRTDLGRDRDEQRPERFQVGQKFDAMVTGFDRSKKPTFSIKAMQISEEKEAVAQYGSSDSGASLGDILGEALKARNADKS